MGTVGEPCWREPHWPFLQRRSGQSARLPSSVSAMSSAPCTDGTWGAGAGVTQPETQGPWWDHAGSAGRALVLATVGRCGVGGSCPRPSFPRWTSSSLVARCFCTSCAWTPRICLLVDTHPGLSGAPREGQGRRAHTSPSLTGVTSWLSGARGPFASPVRTDAQRYLLLSPANWWGHGISWWLDTER